ncbi:MAG: MscL family protein [Methanomassiliicoccales archaeon]
MGIAQDFRKFVVQNNFVTVAVAFVMGLAVSSVITALVNSVINPLIAIPFHVNFAKIGLVTINGSTFTFGALLGAVINFIVIVAVIFFVIVYPYEKYNQRVHPPAPQLPTKTCTECFSEIDKRAKRCKYCTAVQQ